MAANANVEWQCRPRGVVPGPGTRPSAPHQGCGPAAASTRTSGPRTDAAPRGTPAGPPVGRVVKGRWLVLKLRWVCMGRRGGCVAAGGRRGGWATVGGRLWWVGDDVPAAGCRPCTAAAPSSQRSHRRTARGAPTVRWHCQFRNRGY